MSRAWIALGSNLGDSAALLDQALAEIAQLPGSRLIATAARYRTAPVGGPEQGDFLNTACEIDTRLRPEQLLAALQRIEQQAGRTRLEHWGPRTLDLDLIVYEGVEQTDPKLTLPHPRAHQRAFVLHPLADLNAQLSLAGQSVQDWLPSVADQRIERLPD